MSPKVLLLDEPTTGLDEKTKNKIAAILSELPQSYVVISHEMEFLSQVSEKVYTMENGGISADHKLFLHQHIHAHYHGAHPHEHR
jgi:cobalt/nickel transport system ATP-binding protein